MDDGRLTDGQGRTVDFKNTVLIMTSNIPGGRAGVEAQLQAGVHQPPRRHRRVRRRSSREQLREIVDLQVARLIVRVAERGVDVELTDAARDLLGDLGYDPAYGARPLKRVISKRLVDPLALGLLKGEFAAGDRIVVDADEGEPALRADRASASPSPFRLAIFRRTWIGQRDARLRPSGRSSARWSNWIVQTPTCGLFLNGNCCRLDREEPAVARRQADPRPSSWTCRRTRSARRPAASDVGEAAAAEAHAARRSRPSRRLLDRRAA